MQSLLFEAGPEQRAADAVTRRSSYLARLSFELGDGRDWEYTGECNERRYADGKCTCGHAGIKFEFLIRNKRTHSTRIVGSTCIEQFGQANPALVAEIKAAVVVLERRAAERLKAAKELARSQEVQAALAEFDALAWELDRILATGAEAYTWNGYSGKEPQTGYRDRRRVSREIYLAWGTPARAAYRVADYADGKPYPNAWKPYKSKAAFLTAIRRTTADLRRWLAGRIWE